MSARSPATPHALALLLAIGLAAPALAEDAGELTSSVRVPAAATHSPADERRLDRHLAQAALDVCGAAGTTLAPLRDAVRRSDCYRDALSRAQAQRSAATASATPTPPTGNP